MRKHANDFSNVKVPKGYFYGPQNMGYCVLLYALKTYVKSIGKKGLDNKLGEKVNKALTNDLPVADVKRLVDRKDARKKHEKNNISPNRSCEISF